MDFRAVPSSFMHSDCLEGRIIIFILLLPSAEASRLAFNRYFSKNQRMSFMYIIVIIPDPRRCLYLTERDCQARCRLLLRALFRCPALP